LHLPGAAVTFRARSMRTYELLSTPLLATSYSEFTEHCHELARRRGTYAVDLTNTHIVTLRRQNPRFREITSRFDYFVPDSTPLIWCLNRKGAGLRDRVYGPVFMRYCIEHSPAPFTHYLLGGSAECVQRLTTRFGADAQIVGRRDGYFRAEDEPAIAAEINRLSPDFIWVGLGTPKQQEWIHRQKSAISRGVIFAVGFAFDVNAGMKKDAPAVMQRLGLTWLFRALSEPRRLLTRYLRYNSLFLYYLAKDALAARH
jgi:N-acetylglucosaminyldiphosphoundecaprenol N-acetyl-beta-D-mannosaminyltransferase